MGREWEGIKTREETGREKEYMGITWKTWACGAGQTIQWLKALATLVEDPASIPSTDAEWLYNHLYLQLQGILHSILASIVHVHIQRHR